MITHILCFLGTTIVQMQILIWLSGHSHAAINLQHVKCIDERNSDDICRKTKAFFVNKHTRKNIYWFRKQLCDKKWVFIYKLINNLYKCHSAQVGKHLQQTRRLTWCWWLTWNFADKISMSKNDSKWNNDLKLPKTQLNTKSPFRFHYFKMVYSDNCEWLVCKCKAFSWLGNFKSSIMLLRTNSNMVHPEMHQLSCSNYNSGD